MCNISSLLEAIKPNVSILSSLIKEFVSLSVQLKNDLKFRTYGTFIPCSHLTWGILLSDYDYNSDKNKENSIGLKSLPPNMKSKSWAFLTTQQTWLAFIHFPNHNILQQNNKHILLILTSDMHLINQLSFNVKSKLLLN